MNNTYSSIDTPYQPLYDIYSLATCSILLNDFYYVEKNHNINNNIIKNENRVIYIIIENKLSM